MKEGFSIQQSTLQKHRPNVLSSLIHIQDSSNGQRQQMTAGLNHTDRYNGREKILNPAKLCGYVKIQTETLPLLTQDHRPP